MTLVQRKDPRPGAPYVRPDVKHYFVAPTADSRKQLGWDGRCLRCGADWDDRAIHFETFPRSA